MDDNRRILRAVDENFGPKPSIAVFHSWSTITALIHEQQEATFAAMVLFDAPIYSPGYDLGQMETVVQRLAKGARRRADPTAAFSFLPSMDLSTLLELDYDFIPDTTHFLQLEMPERCAAMTVEFLDEHGLA